MIYAKMENNKPVFCPRNGYVNGIPISNLAIYFQNNPEVAKQEGWKIFIPCEEPADNLIYEETDDNIFEIASEQ